MKTIETRIKAENEAARNKTLHLTREQWRQAGRGALLGIVIGYGLTLLGVYALIDCSDIFILSGLAGAWLGLTRARRLPAIGAVLTTAMVFVVAYTPLAASLITRWNRTDAIPGGWAAPAVVVLSSHVQIEQTLDSHAQERILRGYEILRKGQASSLVLTDADEDYGPQTAIVQAQMQTLGLRYPTEHLGPVHDTHDEAVAVSRLAKQRGWATVILVTHPWHMRRAAAVFEKAGLHVVCAACVEGSYDAGALTSPWPRLMAFRDWLHEAAGCAKYRLKGWI